MHKEPDPDNPNVATRFSMREFVSRTEFKKVSRVIGHVLTDMGESSIVEPGSREFHQIEAMKAAQMVGHHFTKESKKQAKRDCLGHLIASLAPNGASKNKASSA
ncbi:hypothetical protein [Pseudomonas sp.]|uniref:hypothetical protein n=1 Tax=Pseudomonas sp. TaxID=306 RepID=UPI0032673C00